MCHRVSGVSVCPELNRPFSPGRIARTLTRVLRDLTQRARTEFSGATAPAPQRRPTRAMPTAGLSYTCHANCWSLLQVPCQPERALSRWQLVRSSLPEREHSTLHAARESALHAPTRRAATACNSRTFEKSQIPSRRLPFLNETI